jgi:putative transposase
MPRFLRFVAPGGTFFFTLVTYQRRPIFALPIARRLLRHSIREVQRRRPFTLEGFVLLPDHLHCVMVLPSGDTDFSTRWRKIKEGFTRSYLAKGPTQSPFSPGPDAGRIINPTIPAGRVGRVIDPTWQRRIDPPVSPGQARKGLRGVWQQRFWEHTIRDETDFGRHMDYIHFNPVKHGHATCPHAWPWSTFTRWVREGVYERDWYCVCQRRRKGAPDFTGLDATAME